VGRVIAVANQKGGVGKTTTITNMGACIAQQGKRVLTVDMDPQGNTTSGLGLEKNKLDITLYDLLMGQCLIEDALQDTCVASLKILPSNMELAGAEVELIGRLHRGSC
jgi:chromosome partitioning protein